MTIDLTVKVARSHCKCHFVVLFSFYILGEMLQLATTSFDQLAEILESFDAFTSTLFAFGFLSILKTSYKHKGRVEGENNLKEEEAVYDKHKMGFLRKVQKPRNIFTSSSGSWNHRMIEWFELEGTLEIT